MTKLVQKTIRQIHEDLKVGVERIFGDTIMVKVELDSTFEDICSKTQEALDLAFRYLVNARVGRSPSNKQKCCMIKIKILPLDFDSRVKMQEKGFPRILKFSDNAKLESITYPTDAVEITISRPYNAAHVIPAPPELEPSPNALAATI